jgi:cytochrome P450
MQTKTVYVALTLTQSLFDLISHPREEYATPIKAQIESVSNKHGGRWSHQALQELTLLDSFIKESQRLHPMSVVLGTRKVMKSGGHRFEATTKNSAPVHLPEGSIVMMPTYGLHSDPSIYPDPNHFQGFRHIKAADTESKPNDQFLSFGHGERDKL